MMLYFILTVKVKFFHRLNIDELERTSTESEVYDVDVGGEDDTEDTDELATDVCEEDRKIKVLQADEINDVEFCIASSETILTLLYRLHGNICTKQGCDEMLEFKDTYCGTCGTCSNLEVPCGAFWWQVGLPTFLCWSPGWQFVASIGNCLVWKFVFESWIFIQNHEHEIHFQDVV